MNLTAFRSNKGYKMLLHRKIRCMRHERKWSQETMANKLDMSPNGYGSIERGETNVQISRLLQIAKIFEVDVSELFDLASQNIFNSMGSNNTEIQNNNDSRCYYNSEDQNECKNKRQQLEFDVERQDLIIKQQEKEITLLRKINELMETNTKLILWPPVEKRSAHQRRKIKRDEEVDRRKSPSNAGVEIIK